MTESWNLPYHHRPLMIIRSYQQVGGILYIQNESPGKDKEANWLPAPKGRFILMLRLYWPDEPPQVSILDGSWKPPVAKMVQ